MRREGLIARLQAALGPPAVLHSPEELMLYEYDGSVLDLAEPDIVVVPATTAEVAAAVRLAAEAGGPVTARGQGRAYRAVRCRLRAGWSCQWHASTGCI